MNVVEIIVIFTMVWWLVFFMALPIGVRRPENPQPGFASSAPDQPRLWIKAAATTAIALVVTTTVAVIVELEVFPPMRDLLTR